MQHSDARLPANVEKTENTDHNSIGSDCAQGELAPDHCPVCLSKLHVKRTYRLADDGNRRYRYCPRGCYEDRTVMIVEKASIHALD